MSSVETNVNSYDAGQFKPYSHDKTRGKWLDQWDFYLSCIGHAFGVKNFMFIVGYIHIGKTFSVASQVPSIISLLLFAVPIFFVQSFIGQFSSTGYISVFRISPLFKGIGYVILALNFTNLFYHSSIATYPLLFFLNSFTLNTTWMYCDNSWNTEHCTEILEHDGYDTIEQNKTVNSLESAFEYSLYKVLNLKLSEEGFHLSWTIILGGVFLWTIVSVCIYNGIEMIGRILRYTTLVALSLGLISFIRVLFLPEVGSDLVKLFKPNFEIVIDPRSWIYSLILCTISLGNGWGTTLTMASYQPFKKNTEKYSFLVPVGITVITFFVEIFMYLIESYISRRAKLESYYLRSFGFHYAFTSITHFFGTIEASQMWSMIFYLMLFLFELNSIVLQIFSIVTAVCDEYENLREYKKKLSIGLCGVCWILSCCFATNYMTESYLTLAFSSYFVQMLICFLEVIIVVWIYGRLRFLRDVEFILSKRFAAWKFYIIRFVTPTFIFLLGAFYLLASALQLVFGKSFMMFIIAFMKGLPWFFIPVYIIMKLLATTGTIGERFKKCIRPNDWYPADPIDKQKYELSLGTSDISQQLLEMQDQEEVP